MSNSNTVDPKVLAAMKEEVSFLQSQQRGARRIKLEKGHQMIVRFLPAKLGPRNLWYARIAKHWLNKVPITCPRLTAEDFGGDRSIQCPVCLISDELNDDRDKDTSAFGWRLAANPQYLTYCILWEKDDVKMPMNEVIIPYEFQLAKATWEELRGFYQGGSNKSPDSVLDYHKGNDFSVIRTNKGTRLDKLTPSSAIFDEDDKNFDVFIKKIDAAMKNPKVQIPTAAQLEAFADKVQEEAIKLHRHRYADEEDDRPRRRRAVPEEDTGRSRRSEPDDDEPAPRRRQAAEDEDEPAPRRRQAAEDEDEPAPRRSSRNEDNDDGDLGPARRSKDEEPVPRRRTAREDDDVDPDAASPRGREEDPDEKPGRREKDKDPDAETGEQEREEDPDAGADEPREEDPDEKPSHDEEADEPSAQAQGKLSPTENRAKAQAGRPAKPEAEDEDDNLPEDDKDKVPPAKYLPPKSGDTGEEPPPVERKGKTIDAIQSRLRKLKEHEKA